MPHLINADNTVRDLNWPSQNKPVMMDAINDADRKARSDAYQAAKTARGGLKSYSYIGEPTFDGRIQRKDNTSGEIEWVNV
jgi:hypothetical protein